MAKHTFCHIEWEVTDLNRARAFYGGLFDWKFDDFGDMVVFGSGNQHLGGLSKVERVEVGASPSVWIEVEDLEAHLAKAASLGGAIHTPKQALPGVGWSGVATDPDGNRIGMVQFDRK